MLKISKYSVVAKYKATLNGETIFSQDNSERYQDFLIALYRNLKIQYPKFFKMDMLSKLGFLSTEICMPIKFNDEIENNYNTAVFMICNASSLDTDKKYQDTLADNNYFPSPKVFVYTLSNILLGEIAIRHKLFGENMCFLSEKIINQEIIDYIYQCFLETKIDRSVVVWADYLDENGESVALIVEKESENNKDKMNFNVKSINCII